MTPPELPEQPQRYTFVLSLWRESTSAPWRVALRAADGETRLGFATIEQLAAFLLRLADSPAPADRAEHPAGGND